MENEIETEKEMEIDSQRDRETDRKGERDSEALSPFGPSVGSPCHPCITTTHLSYWFPILETSATALWGTIGILSSSNVEYLMLKITQGLRRVLCWWKNYSHSHPPGCRPSKTCGRPWPQRQGSSLAKRTWHFSFFFRWLIFTVWSVCTHSFLMTINKYLLVDVCWVMFIVNNCELSQ